jgi:hypothetical protein
MTAAALRDRLCICGHRGSSHAEPGSGDTRCLAVEASEDLAYVLDDVRETEHAYCACLRFIDAKEPR